MLGINDWLVGTYDCVDALKENDPPLRIGCDQLTTFNSFSCTEKFPEVRRNFFGIIGA